ncbi:MAG TPA: hypothetical protein VJ417_02600 [Candidatus Glassbacteria bacterium]|nr:hypothetical protein [Candidatus Glassbacteria bacterium]
MERIASRTLILFIFLALALSCAKKPVQQAAALGFRAPAALELPAALSPPTSSNWQPEGDGWRVGAGETGALEVAAWWEGDRPPEPEMVVLEFEYLDRMNSPARASVYSGLGLEGTFSELHRFGGTGDGQWKTAKIACPWDMALKHLPDDRLIFQLVSDSSSLDVRHLSLTAPGPSDEENYNRETREWVARVQAAKATVDSNYWNLAQKPDLPEDLAGRKLIVYQRNWMDAVLPASAPQAGETVFPALVRMTQNEYQPLQLGVYANGAPLEDVRVSVDPVTDSRGRVVAQAKARVAEYSLVRSRVEDNAAEPFPQRLWPAYPFTVPAGQSHLVWIELKTSEDISVAGIYRTTVRFSAAGMDDVAVPVDVEILPLRLATMSEVGLKLGGHTLGLTSERDLAFQREYNHNMLDLWYGAVRPEVKASGDSLVMDFRLLDDFMARAVRQGFSDVYYFLGGNPYDFPLSMDLERHLARAALGWDDSTFRRIAMARPDSVDPRVAKLISEWTRRFSRHAFDHGWPRFVLTPFDEPAKWVQTRAPLGNLAFIRPHFNHWASLLRRGDPHVMVSADIHHYQGGVDFLPWLDVVCTNATHENLAFPDEVRAAGKIFWEFGGCNDTGTPDRARYVLGFYFAGHDSRATQLWAYNWGDRFDTLDGENWLYAWYTPFDVIPHIFAEGVREGLDDRRLLETLKRAAERKGEDISGFLADLFREVAAAEPELRGAQITRENFWQAGEKAKAMDRWHQALLEKLLALQE